MQDDFLFMFLWFVPVLNMSLDQCPTTLDLLFKLLFLSRCLTIKSSASKILLAIPNLMYKGGQQVCNQFNKPNLSWGKTYSMKTASSKNNHGRRSRNQISTVWNSKIGQTHNERNDRFRLVELNTNGKRVVPQRIHTQNRVQQFEVTHEKAT